MLSFAVLARRARPALRKSIRRAMTSTRGIPQIGGNPKLVEFELLTASDQQDGPRLGRFTFKGRPSFDTPHFVASSSRGTVSHMTQDMMRDQTAIKSMYAAVEDCEYEFTGLWSCFTRQHCSHGLESHRESPTWAITSRVQCPCWPAGICSPRIYSTAQRCPAPAGAEENSSASLSYLQYINIYFNCHIDRIQYAFV